jgi:cellulose synthase/poly-beta-1,6-N-acetylglucosamine synthase-like glycosyltransferase
VAPVSRSEVSRSEVEAQHAVEPLRQEEPLELSVVMPCLNEEETLATCIRKAQRAIADANVAGEVIVADNGSTDRSIEIAEQLGARVVHVNARGYGNALISPLNPKTWREFPPNPMIPKDRGRGGTPSVPIGKHRSGSTAWPCMSRRAHEESEEHGALVLTARLVIRPSRPYSGKVSR